MDEPRARDEIADVVRAHRIEVVDKRGHLVAVLDGDAEAAGLRIYDRQGSERITAAVSHWGAFLSLALGGDTVAEIHVLDDVPENEPGVTFFLSDSSGTPVLEWTVLPDGELIEKRPEG